MNLSFSTDPDPKKSKSKSIFMTGTRLRHLPKPAPLQLCARDLPWVSSATHLGHELHQDATMDYDCRCKKAKFIDSSTDIRETFKFADQAQVLKAVQTYCGDFYGSMLWNLYGEQAAQYFRCWNTCVKLSWDLPRETHVYYVDNLLACGYSTIRQQVLSRYVKFFRTLLKSPCKEVAVVARIVGRDASTNTGRNILNLSLETRLCPRTSPLSQFRDVLSAPVPVPPGQDWTISLLKNYLSIRKKHQTACEDTSYIDGLLDSLCST